MTVYLKSLLEAGVFLPRALVPLAVELTVRLTNESMNLFCLVYKVAHKSEKFALWCI